MSELSKKWWYRRGVKPMNENKSCASYLGVYIAENALRGVFDTMQRMPANNPGYDFICGKGFKIDVKSSTWFDHGNGRWCFSINRNAIADYFLCVGFDNRDNLEPLHIWLIPGNLINHKKNITISCNKINKWEAFELSVSKVIIARDAIKGVA